MEFIKITAISPVNIATIKYWGKRDEDLIIPLNDSISVTLNPDHMHAKTTIMASSKFKSDRIWINGVEESINNPRLQNCLKAVRRLANERGEGNPVTSWKVHVCSENNFPTAAGLASSAAGYSCLVYVLSKLFQLDDQVDITTIARQGSGSACRSLYGGFVRWCSGTQSDGSDSLAVQLKPASSWINLHILILVVNDAKKSTSSTIGMERSKKTSKLLKYRIETCVNEHIDDMMRAINEKDFHRFSEITMKDSNQFHAICLDTYPPAVYMNDTSHLIAAFVHNYNSQFDHNKIGYTFDAGPNACLFVLENDVDAALSSVMKTFPPPENNVSFDTYVKGIPLQSQHSAERITIPANKPGLLKYIIHTNIGDGPRVLSSDFDLLTDDGIPKTSRNI